MKDVFPKLIMTFGIVAILMIILILIGTYIGPYWAVGTFIVLLGAGIWFWNWNEKRNKCPLLK